ncbi:unnamed protein product [Prorocentrum cordatum]|uniref:Phospholipase B-like n=1 Tax=Prorocentrum cordatum TaxID=2364126 RepID=A0ABN9T9H3_9DINO|nr:unnamed protein product [Polarella glacialis]
MGRGLEATGLAVAQPFGAEDTELPPDFCEEQEAVGTERPTGDRCPAAAVAATVVADTAERQADGAGGVDPSGTVNVGIQGDVDFVEGVEKQLRLWGQARPGRATRPFVRRRARVDAASSLNFWAAYPAGVSPGALESESDSSEDVAADGVRNQKGQLMTRDEAWEEYLAMEAKGARLPAWRRPRFNQLEAFLGLAED